MGCDLVSTLCKYALRKGDVFVLSWGKCVTSKTEKYLFSAANVWWRCAQYFVIALKCGDQRYQKFFLNPETLQSPDHHYPEKM